MRDASGWLASRAVQGSQSAELAGLESLAIGSTGRRVFGIRFRTPGRTTLRLRYRSSYNNAGPHAEYLLNAEVEPRRRGISVEQFMTASDEDWAAAVQQRQDAYTTADLAPRTVASG